MSDYNLTDIYEVYKDEVKNPVSWEDFQYLCEEFNKRVIDDIVLEGGVFNQGFYLSELSVLKIPRNFKRKQVDWKESNKRKKELLDEGKELWNSDTCTGHKWLVYYTDPWYCRFYWSKYSSSVPNRGKYQFIPTRGAKGNKTKLYNLLTSNPIAHTRFRKAQDVNLNFDK